MNRDFALRSNPQYNDPAMVNIFDAVYHNKDLSSSSSFVPGFQNQGLANSSFGSENQHWANSAPVLKENPNKEWVHPLFPKEDHTNPEWRKKHNLPAQTPSLYFDPSAYVDYPSYASAPLME
jgi:hypothetical protein